MARTVGRPDTRISTEASPIYIRVAAYARTLCWARRWLRGPLLVDTREFHLHSLASIASPLTSILRLRSAYKVAYVSPAAPPALARALGRTQPANQPNQPNQPNGKSMNEPLNEAIDEWSKMGNFSYEQRVITLDYLWLTHSLLLLLQDIESINPKETRINWSSRKIVSAI